MQIKNPDGTVFCRLEMASTDGVVQAMLSKFPLPKLNTDIPAIVAAQKTLSAAIGAGGKGTTTLAGGDKLRFIINNHSSTWGATMVFIDETNIPLAAIVSLQGPAHDDMRAFTALNEMVPPRSAATPQIEQVLGRAFFGDLIGQGDRPAIAMIFFNSERFDTYKQLVWFACAIIPATVQYRTAEEWETPEAIEKNEPVIALIERLAVARLATTSLQLFLKELPTFVAWDRPELVITAATLLPPIILDLVLCGQSVQQFPNAGLEPYDWRAWDVFVSLYEYLVRAAEDKGWDTTSFIEAKLSIEQGCSKLTDRLSHLSHRGDKSIRVLCERLRITATHSLLSHESPDATATDIVDDAKRIANPLATAQPTRRRRTTKYTGDHLDEQEGGWSDKLYTVAELHSACPPGTIGEIDRGIVNWLGGAIKKMPAGGWRVCWDLVKHTKVLQSLREMEATWEENKRLKGKT